MPGPIAFDLHFEFFQDTKKHKLIQIIHFSTFSKYFETNH
jgi:hypothetical protein